MLPYFAGLILVAYMASVQVYKIWYVVTAGVIVLSPALVTKASWRDVRNFFSDSKWFILYWSAVALSVVTSINPARSQATFLIDSIYPCVFAIFYAVGLFAPFDAIQRVLRLQVWAAVLVLALTFEVTIAGRMGYRIPIILPYVIPFVIAAMSQGRKLGFAELAVLMLVLVVANSRAPIAVAIILIAISAFVFRASMRQFISQSLIAILGCLFVLGGAMLFTPTRLLILTSVVRVTGHQIESSGHLIEVPPDDHARSQLNELFYAMIHEGGWTGIGYNAFGPIYLAHWGDEYADMSLHSIYQVWWLEMGYLGTAAALVLLAAFFLRMYQTRSDMTVRACSLGAIGTLITGGFHQMHQAPMLYVMLGMGLGAARQALASKQRPAEFNATASPGNSQL